MHAQFTILNEANRVSSHLPRIAIWKTQQNVNSSVDHFADGPSKRSREQTQFTIEEPVEERQSVVKEPSKNLSNRFNTESLDFELRT